MAASYSSFVEMGAAKVNTLVLGVMESHYRASSSTIWQFGRSSVHFVTEHRRCGPVALHTAPVTVHNIL